MSKKGSVNEELVYAAGIERDDERFLYFIDKRGNVMRMERGVPRARTEQICQTGIKREKGYMYYLNAAGDVVRAPDTSRG